MWENEKVKAKPVRDSLQIIEKKKTKNSETEKHSNLVKTENAGKLSGVHGFVDLHQSLTRDACDSSLSQPSLVDSGHQLPLPCRKDHQSR